MADEKQPHSPTSEEALLGAILIDGEIISEVTLIPEDFYIIRNRKIYYAMLELHQTGQSIDYLTVTKKLEQQKELNDIGGHARVMELFNRTPTSLNWESYAEIILKLSQRRQVLQIASSLAKAAYDENNDLGINIDLARERLINTQKVLPAAQARISTFADIANIIGPLDWAWRKWLPNGMLSILAGESGAGKSWLALRICGSFLLGLPWPDGTPFTGEKGAVLWCEAEGAQALNVERSKTLRLPLELIYNPFEDSMDDLKLQSPGHMAILAAKAKLPEVKFIVVDSLRGVLGKVDENSSDTFNFIKLLAEIARDSGKPVLLLHHMRKRSVFDSDTVELERLRGSSAIVQTARVVWALDVPDLTDKETKRLACAKSNLSEKPQPIGLSIGANGVTFCAAPEAQKVETVADKAVDLLLSVLAREPKPMKEVEERFTEAGISVPSMKRAKERLKVVSFKTKSGWMWSLPAREDNIDS